MFQRRFCLSFSLEVKVTFFLQGIVSDGIGNSKQNVQHGFHKKRLFLLVRSQLSFQVKGRRKKAP